MIQTTIPSWGFKEVKLHFIELFSKIYSIVSNRALHMHLHPFMNNN